MHKQRLRKTGSLGTIEPLKRERGEGTDWTVTAKGYVTREFAKTTNGVVTRRLETQHRTVMEGAIGRPLAEFENVHHLNGVRNDNRIENLELWVTMQPTGQRPIDLLAYADEIYTQYGHMREAA